MSSLALSITQIRASVSDQSDKESLYIHNSGYMLLKITITKCLLKETILCCFPNQKASLKEPLKKFWSIKDKLSFDDDLIVYGCHLYTPHNLRATMLIQVHEVH